MSREAELVAHVIDLHRLAVACPAGYEAGRAATMDLFAALEAHFDDLPHVNIGSLLDLVHLYTMDQA